MSQQTHLFRSGQAKSKLRVQCEKWWRTFSDLDHKAFPCGDTPQLFSISVRTVTMSTRLGHSMTASEGTSHPLVLLSYTVLRLETSLHCDWANIFFGVLLWQQFTDLSKTNLQMSCIYTQLLLSTLPYYLSLMAHFFLNLNTAQKSFKAQCYRQPMPTE